ncbi:unnamed protein product [Rotaria magnacalcarata]|uniref:Endonuclease/exonuclease/phosphatase domain-containing protein n=4 Tax=Rotaria magnacalcarata TaxID=392030 RepID=A0A816W7M7_9BILA|nr:unnamed protein product [Rotaria magnacalcarata]
MYDSGVKFVNDYTMIYSGAPSDNKTRKAHGVAICLDPIATKVWKDSGSEWEAVSERIIKIRLKCTPIDIAVLSVYSPVNPSTKKVAEDADKFYFDLQDTINNVSTNDMLIIMVDLNARMSGNQQQLSPTNCVGPFTVDVENENGTRLKNLCEINNIIVLNTFFQHKLLHQTSWMHPGNKIWHMIDYTLANKKFRSSVEHVRMYRRASGAIGTDHHLMRTKIKIHLKSRRKCGLQKKISMDAVKLKDEKLVEAFQKDLREMVDDAEEHFIPDKKFNRKRKEWLTDEILKIIDKKAMAFVEWQNHRGTNLEANYRNKYKRLRKLAKTKIEHRQEEYWDEICEDIEKFIKINDPANAFSIIRRLKRGNKRVENMPIKDKNGKLLVNSTDRLERWREYFCELFNIHSTVDPDVINEIQITTPSRSDLERQNAQPSIEEVERALNQMKSRKAPGSDEVTADILKAGGEPVIKWLHEIFNDVWENEKMVKEWSSATLVRLYKNKGDKSCVTITEVSHY